MRYDLVTDVRTSPSTRRAILQQADSLLDVFGTKEGIDFLLPLVISFLNDRDWEVRLSFLEAVKVTNERERAAAATITPTPESLDNQPTNHAHCDANCLQQTHLVTRIQATVVEEFLLPCVEQALSDPVESVVIYSILSLTKMAQMNKLKPQTLISTVKKGIALLCHPSSAIRRAYVHLVVTAAKSLDPIRVLVSLMRVLKPVTAVYPVDMSTPESFARCLRSPLSQVREGGWR